VLQGVSAEATLDPERAAQLDFPDWLAIFRDQAAVNREFLTRLPRCVLNPGCFYHQDGVWLFHRRAKALRGMETVRLDDGLRNRWEARKRVALKNYPCVGEATGAEKLSLLLKQSCNRGAFLLPAGRQTLPLRSCL